MAKVIYQDVEGELTPMPPVVIDGVEKEHKPCGQVYAKLSAVHISGKTGKRTDRGVLSTGIVTTAFMTVVTGAMRGNAGALTTLQAFLFHGCGTGTWANLAEANSNTALYAETTYVTSGVRTPAGDSGGSGVTYTNVGTITFAGIPTSLAISEHGLFSASEIGEGTLLDRSVFDGVGGRAAPITVVSTDQIIFTYTLTCTGS